MTTATKTTNATKIKVIKASGLSWLDNQYLNMLTEAIKGDNAGQSKTAQTKIDEWYWEVIWK